LHFSIHQFDFPSNQIVLDLLKQRPHTHKRFTVIPFYIFRL